MPFVSKDWRDPGENWVKTQEGWEKLKIIQHSCSESDDDITIGSSGESDSESQPRSLFQRAVTQLAFTSRGALEEIQNSHPRIRRRSSSTFVGQPHCHITLKCTKEIAGFNRLSEVLKRLDFRSAIRDAQRFNYICKFLDILITSKLDTLTGGAQKVLFALLEEVTLQVSYNQQNLHVLRRLLQNLQKRIEDYLWWGSMLGSVVLWERQRDRFEEINRIVNNIEINPPDANTRPTIQEIPHECVREIVRRLDNHMDIVSAGKAYSGIASVGREQKTWEQLCDFHWKRQQINYIIRTHKELQIKRDWEKVYHRLRKKYGLTETYASMIFLCKNCQCLYWENLGHPCFAESNPDIRKRLQTRKDECVIKVPPKVFLSYFSI